MQNLARENIRYRYFVDRMLNLAQNLYPELTIIEEYLHPSVRSGTWQNYAPLEENLGNTHPVDEGIYDDRL